MAWMTAEEQAALNSDWHAFAHRHQCTAEIAGNGAALDHLADPRRTRRRQDARRRRMGVRGRDRDKYAHIALVGETEHDAREVMVEGVSGLLAVHRYDEKPQWIPTRRRLQWPNGAVAQVFSAEEPEELRGPQFSAAWCDELAKWRQAEATFDMLQFGLRLGERPRQVITTTPRLIALIKKLIADPATALTRAGTQRQRPQSGAGLSRPRAHALRRHAAGAPGDRRRDRRGAPGCAVDARRARNLPRRKGAFAIAHRGGGRSAGVRAQRGGCLRHRRRRRNR